MIFNIISLCFLYQFIKIENHVVIANIILIINNIFQTDTQLIKTHFPNMFYIIQTEIIYAYNIHVHVSMTIWYIYIKII